MKSLLQQFWFQSLTVVFIGLAAIWVLGPAWQFNGGFPLASEFNRLLGMFVIVVCWGLNNLRLQLVGRRDERGLMAGVLGQGATGDVLDPELRNRLENRLRQTIEVISSRAGFGRYYLRKVPWVAFIGPPGAGKSTAVANCRIGFETADGPAESALRGVGGTRDCEWWFSREAVLMDTAGRYTVHEQGDRDHREWLGFIDLLKRHRERQAISAVIVVVSVQDLLTLRVTQRVAHAHAISLRLDELEQRLGDKLPVYVLLTKADLLAGFRETFAALTQAERREPWGITLPIETSRAGALTTMGQLEQEFDRMVDRLDRRAFGALARENDPRRRSLVFRFPRHVAAIKGPLRQILGQVFTPRRNRAVLRGLYFTSGTQRGAPIDQLLSRVARNFAFDHDPERLLPPSRKSYFLRGVFRDVIFREAGLAQWMSRDRHWSQRRAFGLGIIAAALVFGAASLFYTAGQASAVFNELELAYADASKSGLDAGLSGAWRLHWVAEKMADFEQGAPLMMYGPLRPVVENAVELRANLIDRVILPELRQRMRALITRRESPDVRSAAAATALLRREPSQRGMAQFSTWLLEDGHRLGLDGDQTRKLAILLQVAVGRANAHQATAPPRLQTAVLGKQ